MQSKRSYTEKVCIVPFTASAKPSETKCVRVFQRDRTNRIYILLKFLQSLLYKIIIYNNLYKLNPYICREIRERMPIFIFRNLF